MSSSFASLARCLKARVRQLTAARILLLRSRVDETRQIMAQIYPLASERDLEAKLQAMAFAVKQSTSVGEDTTWSEKLATLFNVGMNRRALSEPLLSHLVDESGR